MRHPNGRPRGVTPPRPRPSTEESLAMRYAREFILNAVVGGLLVVMPVYFAVLLLLKAMQSVVGLVHPLAALLPDWMPAEDICSLLIVLVMCFFVGLVVRTRAGRIARERMEHLFFGRLP